MKKIKSWKLPFLKIYSLVYNFHLDSYCKNKMFHKISYLCSHDYLLCLVMILQNLHVQFHLMLNQLLQINLFFQHALCGKYSLCYAKFSTCHDCDDANYSIKCHAN